MKILSYESNTGEANLKFYPINFGVNNLIVGASGCGKTRLLNTIFNGAVMALRSDKFFVGYWKYKFEHKDVRYIWEVRTNNDSSDNQGRFVLETLSTVNDNGDETFIFNRIDDEITFEGKQVPKLTNRQSCIYLFKEEPSIKPVFEGMSSIMRRNFSGSDLADESLFQKLPNSTLKRVEKSKKLFEIFESSLNVSCKLFLLKKVFNKRFLSVKSEFMSIFPFVKEFDIVDGEEFGVNLTGNVPTIAIKESFNNSWFPISQISSGMKKVILMLVDLQTLPEWGGVYIVDEYENSLGINAINFFPSSLANTDSGSQLIITSHHPYLISNFPVKDWILVYREGENVKNIAGLELEKKFGKSKQNSFTQLINDEYYSEGIS